MLTEACRLRVRERRSVEHEADLDPASRTRRPTSIEADQRGGRPVSQYRVNKDGISNARKLIDAGDVDTTTEWSDAAPSTEDENKLIDSDGYGSYGKWHLAVDTSASEDTKGRFRFPYGDFRKVNRAALIHAKQRAAQNDHGDIEKAADELLRRLDDKHS